ncbi:hypothetical protein ACFVH6_07305 [Spirillospora sp. NPDC127200]
MYTARTSVLAAATALALTDLTGSAHAAPVDGIGDAVRSLLGGGGGS